MAYKLGNIMKLKLKADVPWLFHKYEIFRIIQCSRFYDPTIFILLDCPVYCPLFIVLQMI